MRLRLTRFVALLIACTAGTAACAAPSSEENIATEDGANSELMSCSAQRRAAVGSQTSASPQSHWRLLELTVMQPVSGVMSIRERMDGWPDDNDPLAKRWDAFALAKRAASKLDLLSMDRVAAYLNTRYAVALDAAKIGPDGSYAGTFPESSDPEARRDLRSALYLAKYVFATAGIGVTEGDVIAERARVDFVKNNWTSTLIPISGAGVSLDTLLAGGNGNGSFFCSTPGANNLKTLVRAADTKLGADGNTSLAELVAYVKQQFGATVTLDPWSVTYPAADPPEWWLVKSSFECAFQALYSGAKQIAQPQFSTLPTPSGSGFCETVDLLAHQGRGTTFTGHVVGVTMGQKDYEVVMMSASLLQPGIRSLLCLKPQDQLKLYVPYGKPVISECGLVNGLYRASYYNLDSRVEPDNWSPN